jgi:hypothetical protein
MPLLCYGSSVPGEGGATHPPNELDLETFLPLCPGPIDQGRPTGTRTGLCAPGTLVLDKVIRVDGEVSVYVLSSACLMATVTTTLPE